MKKQVISLFLSMTVLLGPSLSYGASEFYTADSDFFGMKMKSIAGAKDLKITGAQGAVLQYTRNEALTDDKILATAVFDYSNSKKAVKDKNVKGVKITIWNGSKKPLISDATLATFSVLTVDDTVEEMDDFSFVWYPATEKVKPGKKATFKKSIGRLKLKKEDIQMIVCSFDAGNTKIVLVPNPHRQTAPRSVYVPDPPKKDRASRESHPTSGQNNFAWPKQSRPADHR